MPTRCAMTHVPTPFRRHTAGKEFTITDENCPTWHRAVSARKGLYALYSLPCLNGFLQFAVSRMGNNLTVPVADTVSGDFCWRITLFLATGVLLGRRGFVHCVQRGRSSGQVFDLRARSLPYITVWAVLMCVTLVLVLVTDPAEFITVAGLFVFEFVAVTLWRDYFGNSDFVAQYVKETEKRLSYLLTHGPAMNAIEFEAF